MNSSEYSLIIEMNKSYIIGASGLIGGALLDLLKEESIDVIGTYSKNKEKDLLFGGILNSSSKKNGPKKVLRKTKKKSRV